MPRIAALVFVLGALTIPVSAQWFPHVALGGGYELVVIATNRLDEPVQGTIGLRRGNSENWTGTVAVNGIQVQNGFHGFDLPARGTTRLVVTGDTVMRSGYLMIYAGSPHMGTDLDVTCFYNFRGSGRLLDSTGVPRTWAYRGHRFAVEKSAVVDTGFAWSTASAGEPFEVVLTLYDAGGNAVQTKTQTMEGHLSKFFSEVFDNVPDGFVGHVQVVGEAVMGMTILRLEYVAGGFQLTSTPPVAFTPSN